MKKLYKIEGQKSTGWSERTTSVVGIVMEEKNFSMTVIKGINPTIEGFMALIYKLMEEGEFEQNSQYKRKNPYKIIHHVGMSGCQNWQLSYLEPAGDFFYKEYRKNIFSISCFNKVSDVEFFIPDFAIIIGDIVDQLKQDIKKINIKEIPEIDTNGYIMPK